MLSQLLYYSSIPLLSGSFDCDCRTYDMATRENIGLLRGHRYPIAACILMCARAAHEREHRAITVDESGEFRLWNIYVKERSSEAQPLPTLQVNSLSFFTSYPSTNTLSNHLLSTTQSVKSIPVTTNHSLTHPSNHLSTYPSNHHRPSRCKTPNPLSTNFVGWPFRAYHVFFPPIMKIFSP